MDVRIITDAAQVDLGQLAALFVAVGFDRRTDPVYLAALVNGSRWVVSAWDGDHLVGFARAISDGVANGYISTVAVLPAFQRRGIGRLLLRALVAGRDEVKWVLHASVAGEGLYRSEGFVDSSRMLVRPRRSEGTP